MFHVTLSYQPDFSLPPMAKIKVIWGPLHDELTLEAAQDRAKAIARSCLVFGYPVTLDLGPDTDDLLTFTPGDAHYADTIEHPIGSFSWQSKAV